MKPTQPNLKWRRWARRGLFLAAGFAAAGALGRKSYAGPVREVVKAEQHRTITREEMFRPRIERNERPSDRVLEKPLSFSEIPKGNYCAMYARLAAKQLYGFEYERGDAWDLAPRNKSIWKKDSKKDFHALLKAGYMVGIYNPQSKFNQKDRDYTHVGLFVGRSNGKEWIMHRVGTTDKLQPLDELLSEHKGWRIMEIIAPKK